MNADESPSDEQPWYVRGPERDCNSCRAHLINVGESPSDGQPRYVRGPERDCNSCTLTN
jgi:hypothetical protein